MTRLGVGSKQPTANSSTMRGPQGLAGESGRRRCQTANRLRLKGRGMLLRSVPGNHGNPSPWKLCPAGRPGHTAQARGSSPSSDVTDLATIITNLGRPAAAGSGNRCAACRPRVSRAAGRECPASRSWPDRGGSRDRAGRVRRRAVAGSYGCSRVVPSTIHRRKQGRVSSPSR
jgi:hypothetical protein